MLQNLTADQVNSFHVLYGFLRKLKVMGTLRIKTIRSPTGYGLEYFGYDASMKGKLLPHEELQRFFERIIEDENDYTYSELQELCHPRDSDEI